MTSQSSYQGTQVLQSEGSDPTLPLIICFHGSGESCASWWALAQLLLQQSNQAYRVLLYDRGAENPKPDVSNSELVRHLKDSALKPPYVLVAHSYGGAFARDFLQKHPLDVAGMVLVETGQETALSTAVEEDQYRRQILGKKPLSVIRGNSLIGKYAQVEATLQAATSEAEREEIRNGLEYMMLDSVDKEDERLKKRQLGLSSNSRYRHISDVGHHVIRDRPAAVADEVKWVMGHRVTEGGSEVTERNWLKRIAAAVKTNTK